MEAFRQISTTYQGYGLLAFIVTVFATPLAVYLAKRFGVMDRPDQDLKPHARPIPYLGGAAICLGWSAARPRLSPCGHSPRPSLLLCLPANQRTRRMAG